MEKIRTTIRKKKKIKVPAKAIAMLMQAHQTNRSMVYDALSYRRDSNLAKIIRKDAVQNFCGQYVNELVFE